jgi:chemosensory pili system protein ChpA (sensor histidine kinase/response regulator)
VDDQEFDDYLRAGEHLLDEGSNPDELTVERTEGVLALDPYTDVSIDYHEDFHALEAYAQDSASTIAAIVAPVMEEISQAVRTRMASLGLDPGAIAVDVRLGTDEASIKECYAQGFEPVSAICFEMPEPLKSIDQVDRDSMYVRLMNAPLQANWNDLFSTEFSPAGPSAPAPVVEEGGFGEDIFGEDFADDFAAQLSDSNLVAVADIEAAFADLSEELEDSDGMFGAEAAENEGHDLLDSSASPAPQTAVEAMAETPAQLTSPVEEPLLEETTALQEMDKAAFDGTLVGGFVPDYIEFSYTSQSNAEIFTDFLDAFIEEGSAEVEKLETEVGEWEKNVASDPVFAKVSRTLHTIKGIAKGVGLQRLGTLVHNFETLLEKMPRPAPGAEQGYFRIVNAWLDAVVRGVEHVADKRVDVASELPVQAEPRAAQSVPAQLADMVESSSVPPVRDAAQAVDRAQAEEKKPAPSPSEMATAVPSALEKRRDQQLADEGAQVLAAQQSVRITSEKLDHLLNLTAQAQQLGVRASQNTSRSKRSSAELQARLSSVRTHIRKIADRALLNVNARPGSSNPDLDALEMDQYSELQEAASILREGVEDLADLVDVVSRQNMQIETLLKQQSSVISSISSSIQGARVVPVSRLMPGLRRIVRTVSTDLSKIVSFKVLNETGALDRDHYARLQVVLEHMVRNALDHGIESPDERMAMGKPTGGRISIDVRKSGGDYLIRLADDGRGIDPDAIRASAMQKGLKVDVDALSDEEAIRLIFHKGFSTASTLSEISGRGVGMDIVLTELQQIGGDVQIESTVGQGTAFEIRIPSNVSVNGALLVAAAGQSYAIPLNGLVAVDQVPADEFFAAVEQQTTLTISGTVCEPTYLATLCQGMSLPDRSAWEKFVPVIIAGGSDRHMAIAIDKLEEALELVVRSLGSQFSTVPGVAGAATTAEGEAIVALDLNLLVSSAGRDDVAPLEVDQPKNTTLLALVVDDSRTQRMVTTSQLDTVGVETVTAENGLVAIDLLNATHRLPDVILLDVEMPVKDGIQTLREIRKSRRYGHLPVIMVTSRTGSKHRALASDAGCNAYMGKPFNFPALVRQINELTGYDLQLS